MTTRNIKGQQRRLAILDAAVRVVVDKGAGGLTHRAAAAEADVSLASTTYHFPSIADLRRATLRHAASVVGSEFEASLDCGPDEGAAVAALAARWRLIGLARRAEFTALFSLLVEALHDPDLRPDVDELLAKPASALVATGVSADEADAVVAFLIGLALVALVRSEPEAAMRGFDAGVTTLLSGLGQGPAHT